MFLTAILHRGLRNDFFFQFQFKFSNFYLDFYFPFSIWTFVFLFNLDFISLFYLDFFSIFFFSFFLLYSLSVMGGSLNYKSDNRYFNPLSFFVISARHGVQKVEFVHPP